MSSPYKIEKQSDLLIGLLTTQCADLENMVTLEKASILAARAGDYERVLKLNREREALCDKIETFQQQISNLRERLGKNVELVWESDIETRMSEIINLFKLQSADQQFLPNLARQKIVESLGGLSSANGSSNADKRKKSLKFDGVLTR